MSFLESLRSASLNGQDLTFFDDNGQDVKVENATQVEIQDVKFSLAEPSGYKNYSINTMVYFYLSKSLDHQTYLSSVLQVAPTTAVALDPISMLDRKGILDYLSGATSALAGSTLVKEESRKNKYLTNVKNKKFTLFVRSRERTLRNSTSILLSKSGRGFSGIRETVSSLMALKKKEKSSLNNPAQKVSPKMEFVPLIVIPSAVQSLITMYNVKDLLQFQKYIPGENYRSQGIDKPVSVYIERDGSKISPNLPVKYQVIDSVDKLKPADW